MYDLQAFRNRVRELCHRSAPYDDARHATQRDLAEAIGLHPTELSKRLNGNKDAHLSDRDVRSIVLTFAEWGAIQSQVEALDLLTLVGCASFTAAEWQSPPLDMLIPLKGQAATAPPRMGQEQPRSNLPRALTSFVGRKREMAEVEQLIGQTRLLTVTGAGGCGKTRLTLEVAARLVANFADGVWLVELASLSDPQLVPQAVAATLRVREQPGSPLLDTLTAVLRGCELLLVLDNCEHLVQAVAELVHQLLLCCPELQILTTSREPLRTDGEVIWRLPSMSLPEPQVKTTLHSLAHYEAIRLFVERAKAALPGMALTQSNAKAVREICARLDGIPLALELGAAMVRVMSVEQICAHLDDRFALLTAGNRTSLPRQQTLKALIDWSYDLLTKDEQRLLARLAVFAGGFSMEAAEAVCTDQRIKTSAVVIGLGRLVDKSLMLKDEQDDTARYRLLETIRQYAADKLAAHGEEAQLRQQHAAYYLALAEQAEPELRGAQQAIWLNRLEQEHDNMRAALGWSLNQKQAEAVLALRTSKALMRFWLMRGYLREGRRWLEEALAKSSGASALTRASAFSATGILSASSGDYSAAFSCFEQSLKIYRELGDKTGISHVLNNLGNVARDSGDSVAARTYHEESLMIRRELGDSSQIAVSLNNLANVAATQNDFVTARALHGESLMLKRKLGEEAGVAASLNNLAAIALLQGDYPAADQLYRESLLIKRRLGDRVSMAYALEGLGYVAVAQGAFTRAVSLLAAGAALRDSISAPMAADEKEQFDDNMAVCQANLDEVMFTATWLKGRAMPLEEAIDYALNSLTPV